MLLADQQTPLNQTLLEDISEKMAQETLSDTDFRAVFTLFGQLCNQSEDISYELHDFTKSYQFVLSNQMYSVIFQNSQCQVLEGQIELPNLTFCIDLPKAIGILTGQVHSSVAHMNGDIGIRGTRNDALSFQNIFELFLDELN